MTVTGPARLRFDAFGLDQSDACLTRDGWPVAQAPSAPESEATTSGRCCW